MYIGPWQEYRLAQAVGGKPASAGSGSGATVRQQRPALPKKGGVHKLHSKRLEQTSSLESGTPRLSMASLWSEASDDATELGSTGDNTELRITQDVERLVQQLDTMGGDNREGKKMVLENFLRSFAGRSSDTAELAAAPSFTFDLDPNRTRMQVEKERSRKLVQERRSRGPQKLVQLEKKRADFFHHLQASQASTQVAGDTEARTKPVVDGNTSRAQSGGEDSQDDTSSATAGILPTRPTLLLNSFLPSKTPYQVRCGAAEPLKPQPDSVTGLGGPSPAFAMRSAKMEPEVLEEGTTSSQDDFGCIGDHGQVDDMVNQMAKLASGRSAKMEPIPPSALDVEIPFVTSGGVAVAGDPWHGAVSGGATSDGAVEDLLDWTKKLGTGADDDFLFED